MILFKLWHLIWQGKQDLGSVRIDNARVYDLIKLARQ